MRKTHTVFIFCLPFLLFYWMLPFVSGRILGTDYINYHIHHHLDLMFSIKSGSFPLFAPECFYGQSAAAYTQAQTYHPLTWVASILPGYWNGLSLEWFTLLRLATLAICHLAVFHFLRRFPINRWLALILSTITVYNLRMLSLFWHGAALEAYTGFLFLCTAIGTYLLSPSRIKGPLLIIFAAYWLLTSGYPPMVYYGLIGVALFTLLIPFFAATVLENQNVSGKTAAIFWVKTGLFTSIGLLLSAAYLLPFFFDFLMTNSGRIDQPYRWSVEFNDTLRGFMNNFFSPLRSGLGMFGGSPLYLLALATPALKLLRCKIPGNIWATMGIIFVLLLYMQGDRTPTHFLAWKYFPLISTIRLPGDGAMILPLFLMLLLLWLFAAPPLILSTPKKQLRIPAVIPPAIIAVSATIVYWWLPEQIKINPHFACPFNLRAIPGWAEPALIISSCLILGALFFISGTKKNFSRSAIFILLILTVFQLLLLFRWGPPAIETKSTTPTYEEILAEKQDSLTFQKVLYLNGGMGSKTVIRQLKNYFIEPRLAKIYRNILPVADRNEAYKVLNSVRQQSEAVIEHPPATVSPSPVQKECRYVQDSVNLVYSSYNRLVFRVRSCRPAFFVCAYPFTDHWRAWIDNKQTTMYRANGNAQAVLIPQGISSVEFCYWSWAAFYGMLISCLTLATAGACFVFRGVPKAGRYIAIAAPVVAAGALFFYWHQSLYSGQNLQTDYTWQSSIAGPENNIAFGKPTRMSSHQENYPHRYNSRHAVDGDKTDASCFLTDREENPWWMIDLKENTKIKKIAIYKAFTKPEFNHMPFTLSISQDGINWQETRIIEPADKKVLQIELEQSRFVRFIKIQASGPCVLAFTEVEIYPPDSP